MGLYPPTARDNKIYDERNGSGVSGERGKAWFRYERNSVGEGRGGHGEKGVNRSKKRRGLHQPACHNGK